MTIPVSVPRAILDAPPGVTTAEQQQRSEQSENRESVDSVWHLIWMAG